MPEMTGIKRRKYFEGMKIPHTYVIISCIVLLAFIATYLISVRSATSSGFTYGIFPAGVTMSSCSPNTFAKQSEISSQGNVL